MGFARPPLRRSGFQWNDAPAAAARHGRQASRGEPVRDRRSNERTGESCLWNNRPTTPFIDMFGGKSQRGFPREPAEFPLRGRRGKQNRSPLPGRIHRSNGKSTWTPSSSRSTRSRSGFWWGYSDPSRNPEVGVQIYSVPADAMLFSPKRGIRFALREIAGTSCTSLRIQPKRGIDGYQAPERRRCRRITKP